MRTQRLTFSSARNRLARLCLLFLAAALAFRSGAAAAEGIHGYLEYDYSNVETTSTDSSGRTTETRAQINTQTYNIVLDNRIYPNLALGAGGTFQFTNANLTTDGRDQSAKQRSLQPFVDLRLNSAPFGASVGYNRNEQTQSSSLTPSTTLVQENYSANLNWKPVELPLVSVQYVRTNSFDTARTFLDSVQDHVTGSAQYTAWERLGLTYQYSWDRTDDQIHDTIISETVNGGRVTYTDTFLEDRVSLDTSYNGTFRSTDISSGGTGEFAGQLPPLAGLSANDNVPTLVQLAPNPALVDANLVASAGIDIGLPPPGGETTVRNMGLDFFGQTEVNALRVWVNRDLPPAVSASFTWSVYVSQDNLNWTLLQTVAPALFGPLVPRFEIRFQNVTTRYIKVVTSPLSPTVPGATSFPNIFVTELQAFLVIPASQAGGHVTDSSQLFNLNTRARILDSPLVYYELNYLYSKTDSSVASAPSQYQMSNALSLRHRLSRVLLASARVAREDGREARGTRVGYIYSASLTAVPVPALKSALIFSGQRETIGDLSDDTNSLWLNNVATLYRGVTATLAAGVAQSSNQTGQRLRTGQVNGGLGLTPNRFLTLGLNFADTETDQTGGAQPDRRSYNRKGTATASLNPFSALNLTGSYSVVRQSDQPSQTTKAFTANWSPFPDGTLLLNINYSESVRIEDGQKSSAFTPSMRWNITSYAELDASYWIGKATSQTGETETKSFNSVLRIIF